MILTRPGNKRKIAAAIFAHFPEHDLYIEPFFGAGGMFFSKPKTKHNIVNDYDSEVYNLFKVVIDRKEELADFWDIMPVHEDLWKYWKANEEGDPIRKAARFLLFSNFSFMGRSGNTIKYDRSNTHRLVQERLNAVKEQLRGTQLMNCDFRKMLGRISFKDSIHKSFIYNDPPYCETRGGNYAAFSHQDTADLFEVMVGSGCRFAISEFDHPYVLELAAKHNLRVIEIGERRNMKNRRMEILIVNY